MLKLPKQVLTSPDAPRIEALFTGNTRQLRTGGKAVASQWRVTPKMRAALQVARSSKHVLQGLEAIGKSLDRELKGLLAVQAKAEQKSSPRLARLLLLANDGSDRFYHDAESLLMRHAERTWACVLDVKAEELGQLVGATAAKALLIDDRKVLEVFLLALVQGADPT